MQYHCKRYSYIDHEAPIRSRKVRVRWYSTPLPGCPSVELNHKPLILKSNLPSYLARQPPFSFCNGNGARFTNLLLIAGDGATWGLQSTPSSRGPSQTGRGKKGRACWGSFVSVFYDIGLQVVQSLVHQTDTDEVEGSNLNRWNGRIPFNQFHDSVDTFSDLIHLWCIETALLLLLCMMSCDKWLMYRKPHSHLHR